MSLDVYLTMEGTMNRQGSGIFVRENGQTTEITRDEWDSKFPEKEPIVFNGEETDEVFTYNITHNLTTMADKAGIYEALWRPEEIGAVKAKDLITPLSAGLNMLKENSSFFKEFNPNNGWGNYEGLVRFIEEYLNACNEYPESIIGVSR